jgi:hypothetical protein
VLRPFLPESPAWRSARRERRLRPSLAALWQPATRSLVVVTALLAACTLAVPYGALQHVPRIVPGILGRTAPSPREVQQAVSAVFVVQELGSIAGRVLFAAAVVRIASRRRLLRLFLGPCLIACASLAFVAAHGGIVAFAVTVFCAQALFNGMHSFWGNYLPRVFPTGLRGTGESLALNVGGRVLAVTAALLTTQLSNVVPATSIGLRLAYSAGITVTLALMAALVISRWLPEPASERLPD